MRTPIRIVWQKTGEWSGKWAIQHAIDETDILPDCPNCGNINKLFPAMRKDKPNYFWSDSYCMTETDIKNLKRMKKWKKE